MHAAYTDYSWPKSLGSLLPAVSNGQPCLQTVAPGRNKGNDHQQQIRTAAGHKFCLAFDKTVEHRYLSERFTLAFQSGTPGVTVKFPVETWARIVAKAPEELRKAMEGMGAF